MYPKLTLIMCKNWPQYRRTGIFETRFLGQSARKTELIIIRNNRFLLDLLLIMPVNHEHRFKGSIRSAITRDVIYACEEPIVAQLLSQTILIFLIFVKDKILVG